MAPTDLLLKSPPWFKNLLIVVLLGALGFFSTNWFATSDINRAQLSKDIGGLKNQNQDQEVRLSVLEKMLAAQQYTLEQVDKKVDILLRHQLRSGDR